MSAVNNIIYQSVVYLAPVLLCVLGGIFAYKANVLNIALEGMMMAGAFVSMLIANLTGSVPPAICPRLPPACCWAWCSP